MAINWLSLLYTDKWYYKLEAQVGLNIDNLYTM